MKKIIWILVALVVVVVAAALIVPFFIPVETYKEQIALQVRDKTGRDLAIDGPVRFSLLPSLELEVHDVTFSNAPGGRAPEMAKLSQLRIQLELLPLIRGEVEVGSFVLVDAVIHLEVDENGRPNWEFAAAPAAAPAPEAEKPAGKAPGAPGLADIRLGDVRLVNGTVSYFDARSGETLDLSGINMKVSLPDLDSPLEVDGEVVWNDEKVEMEVWAERPRQLVEGGTTAVNFRVGSKHVALEYEGSLSVGEPLEAAGAVELDVPSIRELAAWAGKPLEAEGSGFGPLSVKGKVGVEGKKYTFTGAKLALDTMTADGEFAVDLTSARPYVKARLDVDRIDVNTYMPPPAEAEEPAQPAPEAAPAPADWSDEPIDVSWLNAADADLSLSAGAILVQDMKIGRSALTVALKDGRMVVDLTELALYEGKATAHLVVDGSGEVPAVEKKFDLVGVQAEPLLRDAAGFDRLEGTANGNISISARGHSQREMVKALNGSGSIKFTDGAIKGINIAAMVRNVKSAFLDKGAREAQKTDFAELSGTFRIEKGVLRNDDLKLLNPLLRVNGAGTADMPKRTVNYRLEPKAVATIEGQEGEEDLRGITVPVIIEGPWHDLSYRPDLTGMLGEALKDPTKALEGAKEAVEGLKEGVTGGIGGMLEDVVKPEAPTTEAPADSPLPDPLEGMKRLFGK